MVICKNCGISTTNTIYCSNSCQQAYQRQEKIQLWLLTGNVPWVGTSKDHYIKKYIFDDQGGKCAICSIDNWNGISLTLILDHIDGNSYNSNRANLRLICPNCDSQLGTYKARNKGKGRHIRRIRYNEGKSY